MKSSKALLSSITKTGLLLMIGASLNACAATSWKEEVLLHDGQKIIVERSQTYGGRREPGKSPPVQEQTITFTLPGTSNRLSFTSEYGEDVGRANFNLLGLHILNNTPYLLAEPNLCLAYNKWGRPNPPYVLFKHDGQNWQRIPLAELPAEFKHINLVINTKRENEIERLSSKTGFVPADGVREINGSLTQPEYKTILREALVNAGGSCGEMIYDGKGGWIGLGWFKRQKTYESCLNYCSQENISSQYCPCDKLFKGK